MGYEAVLATSQIPKFSTFLTNHVMRGIYGGGHFSITNVSEFSKKMKKIYIIPRLKKGKANGPGKKSKIQVSILDSKGMHQEDDEISGEEYEGPWLYLQLHQLMPTQHLLQGHHRQPGHQGYPIQHHARSSSTSYQLTEHQEQESREWFGTMKL